MFDDGSVTDRHFYYPFVRGAASPLLSSLERTTFAPRAIPTRWNHLIERETLSFKKLEHVLIEKVEQFFRDVHLRACPEPDAEFECGLACRRKSKRGNIASD